MSRPVGSCLDMLGQNRNVEISVLTPEQVGVTGCETTAGQATQTLTYIKMDNISPLPCIDQKYETRHEEVTSLKEFHYRLPAHI